MFNLSVPSMHLKYDLYCMWLWISKKHKLFFSSFSLHLMRNLHFEGSSLVALLACYVSLSPPNKISIQTITRRAVILSASGMSENLLLISHVKNGTALFVTFLASAQMDSSKELWLGLIRRRCHPHYCVKYCCKKHSGRQEGDLSLWLWLIQARGSTLGLQTRVCCHTRFIYNSSFGLLPWHTTFPLQA